MWEMIGAVSAAVGLVLGGVWKMLQMVLEPIKADIAELKTANAESAKAREETMKHIVGVQIEVATIQAKLDGAIQERIKRLEDLLFMRRFNATAGEGLREGEMYDIGER